MAGDLRHALRAIARMPFVAAVVVLSLAVGIGVNTVVFSWIQAVVFKPLPGVPDATSYYLVEPRTDTGAYAGTSWAEYEDMRERLTSFRDLIASRMTPVYVGAPGRVERAYGLLVSGNYFGALGLRPALGRFLAPEETMHPGGAPVVVVSYRVLAEQAGRPARGRRRIAARQRPRPHRHRRRTARVSGHHARPQLRSLDAGDAGARIAARVARAHRPHPARLRRDGPAAAVRVARAGTSGRRCAHAPAVAGVSGNEREDAWGGPDVRRIAARPSALSADGPRAAAGSDVVAAAHGLRQHGQPDSRAREHAAARNGDSTRARRRPLAHRATADDRERPPRAAGRAPRARRSRSGAREHSALSRRCEACRSGSRRTWTESASSSQSCWAPGAASFSVRRPPCTWRGWIRRPRCASGSARRRAAGCATGSWDSRSRSPSSSWSSRRCSSAGCRRRATSTRASRAKACCWRPTT